VADGVGCWPALSGKLHVCVYRGSRGKRDFIFPAEQLLMVRAGKFVVYLPGFRRQLSIFTRKKGGGRKTSRCKGCGYPVDPSCDFCGECLCEEDSL
jgi:hypothetical protein